jgi:hypothetical protein
MSGPRRRDGSPFAAGHASGARSQPTDTRAEAPGGPSGRGRQPRSHPPAATGSHLLVGRTLSYAESGRPVRHRDASHCPGARCDGAASRGGAGRRRDGPLAARAAHGDAGGHQGLKATVAAIERSQALEIQRWARQRRTAHGRGSSLDGVPPCTFGYSEPVNELPSCGRRALAFEPHEFERDMHMLYRPAPGPSVATVGNLVTPRSSAERCARDGCGRPANDSIHHVSED